MSIKLRNDVYDFLKNLAMIWLPAVDTLYFALAAIWHFPSSQSVVGTIVAVDTFLGVILKLSNTAYVPQTDGRMTVDTSDPNKDVFGLEWKTHPQNFINNGKKVVTMEVVQADNPAKILPEK